jgi:hypothetical protein
VVFLGQCRSLVSLRCHPRPNPAVEGTAQKLRFWVPSLRSAAPHLYVRPLNQMQQHPIAHREFSCRLRTLTASASSGIGVCAVSSVQRARAAHVLALHRPLLRSAFSQPATTDQSRRLRSLNEPQADQRKVQPVSLGCAPEGALILRPFALRRSCKRRGVSQGREKTIPLFSSAGALSPAGGVSHSAPSGAGFQPWPNRRFEGTACKLRLQVPRPLRGRAAPQARRWASQPAVLLSGVSFQ